MKATQTTYYNIYPDDKINNFDYEKIVNNPEIDLYVAEYEGTKLIK